MDEIISLIEARQAFRAESNALDEKRRELDKKIECVLGLGVHRVGGYSVTVQDATEDRFDSTKFKKDHPGLVAEYTKTGVKHIFKIVELKT